MITDEAKLEYLNGKTCVGCGCEPEATGFYHVKDLIVGYKCSCGVMVVNDVLIGIAPPN